MTEALKTTVLRSGIAAVAGVCLMALCACGDHPPSSEPAAAAPTQAQANLAGVPAGSADAPAAAPADPAPPPPPPPSSAPPSAAPTEVIAMAPIPNPPEEPRHTHHWRPYHRHRRHRGWWGPVFTAGRARPHLHHHHRRHARLGVAAPPRAHPARPARRPMGAAAATPQLMKPHAPRARGVSPAPSAIAAAGSTASVANRPTLPAVATPAARYDALAAALAPIFGRGAVLAVPSHFEPNTAADVTLTAPADFAQTLATEAGRQNMLDEAASANLEATLVGDGYVIVPVESQAQALVLGAPTVFRWRVTPQGESHGPLRAEARLTLLASGRSLPLGSVKAAPPVSRVGQAVGIGLLALIALVLVGWVLRTRRPAPVGATRPRPQSTGPRL